MSELFAAAVLRNLVLNHAAAEWKRPPRDWAEAQTQAFRARTTDNRLTQKF